ncbi:MAG: hypothetical protein IJS03_04775 [Eubacterium sp.]|nr:hypothetical protein [Eubacterium sp.]
MKRIIAILISVCLCIVCFSACTSAKSDKDTNTKVKTKVETTTKQSLRKLNFVQDILTYKNYMFYLSYYANPNEAHGTLVDSESTYKMYVDNRRIAKTDLNPDLNDEVEDKLAEYLEKEVFNLIKDGESAVSLRFVQKNVENNSKNKTRYFYKVDVKSRENLNNAFAQIGDDIYVYADVTIGNTGASINGYIVDYGEKLLQNQSDLQGVSNPRVTYYNVVDYDENGEFLESFGGYLLEFDDDPKAICYIFRCYYQGDNYSEKVYRVSDGPFCMSGQEFPTRIDVQSGTADGDGFSEWVTIFSSDDTDFEQAETISSSDWNKIISDNGYTEIEWIQTN